MSLAGVQDAVQAIQGWLDDPPGEAVVRQCIVLRLLMAAGFDIWDPQEIVPEETNAGGRRSDFLVRRGQGRFALEIKGMGVSLGSREYEQAMTYSVHEGSRWAIVTNGRKWVILDEHLPGRYEQRAALTLEMGQDTGQFAHDLYAVLSAEVWADDALAQAVAQVKVRQQRRTDEARIRREKTGVVEATQREFEIATFEKAADAASKMGRITEAERDVLLGKDREISFDLFREIEWNNLELSEQIFSGRRNINLPSSLGFMYTIKGAKATLRWETINDIWVVKAGSTALDRLHEKYDIDSYQMVLLNSLIGRGLIKRRNDGFLEYICDVEYDSASQAAMYIAGRSVNGWECWKDMSGRSAKIYRDG